MGKNKRQQIYIETDIGNFNVDSNEEVAFLHWCEDALKNELIKIDNSTFYQPNAYLLIDSVKIKTGKKEKTLLRAHEYTLDFIIKPTKKLYEVFPDIEKLLQTSFDDNIYIDIKGCFNKNGGDRTFSINQKLLYNRFHIYVNKVIPDKLFSKTFLPEKERFSRKKKILREKYKNLKTLKEIINPDVF